LGKMEKMEQEMELGVDLGVISGFSYRIVTQVRFYWVF
jgi:hypothetical protein